MAASGIGELVRITYAPIPEPQEAAIGEVLVPLARTSPSGLDVTSDWAPAFGVRRAEDSIFSPVELAEEEQLPITSETNYRLRGIILEGSHSLALIEGGNGTEIVRSGEVLSDGRKLIDIYHNGVVMEGPGGQAHIAFLEVNSSGFQGGSRSLVRNGEVGSNGLSSVLEGSYVAEDWSPHSTLQTAHSRPPQLSPPRFFRMAN